MHAVQHTGTAGLAGKACLLLLVSLIPLNRLILQSSLPLWPPVRARDASYRAHAGSSLRFAVATEVSDLAQKSYPCVRPSHFRIPPPPPPPNPPTTSQGSLSIAVPPMSSLPFWPQHMSFATVCAVQFPGLRAAGVSLRAAGPLLSTAGTFAGPCRAAATSTGSSDLKALLQDSIQAPAQPVGVPDGGPTTLPAPPAPEMLPAAPTSSFSAVSGATQAAPAGMNASDDTSSLLLRAESFLAGRRCSPAFATTPAARCPAQHLPEMLRSARASACCL